MKTFKVIILTFIIFINIFWSTKPSIYSDKSIKFDTEVINLGDLTQNNKYFFSINFTNTNTNKIRIENVDSECSCTEIVKFDSLIMTGQKSKINGIFNSLDFKGKVEKKIFVVTNTKPSLYIIKLEANVK